MKDFIKFLLAFISSVFFLLFFASMIIIHLFNIGNILGMLISLFIFVNCVFSSQIKKLREKLYRNRLLKFLWIFGRICICIFGLYAVVISAFMIGASLIEPTEKATAIVLGAKVRGTTPSLSLEGRIDGAVSYLSKKPHSYAVLSGGKGDDEDISEALCMYKEITDKGVKENRLYIEDKSTDTKENIENSYKIIAESGKNKSLAIVSDNYHQLRARLIARKLGIRGKIGAVNCNTNLLLLPTYFVREWVAIPYEFLLKD
ncbi:MAG: YdcF family protein [Acutalibacteraceae bacterium]